MPFCYYCKKPKASKCPQCHVAFFCGFNCRIKTLNHRLECTLWNMLITPKPLNITKCATGKGLKTNRTIKAKTIIYKEKALFCVCYINRAYQNEQFIQQLFGSEFIFGTLEELYKEAN